MEKRDKKGRFIKGQSYSCRTGFQKGHKLGVGNKYVLGKKLHTEKHKQELRVKFTGNKLKLGIPSWNKGMKGYLAGEKHYNWQGGITPIKHQLRHSFEMREWRRKVFERDNYTCVFCHQVGGDLNADHIKPFALYPELRSELSNGRTLCVPCHRKTDTYSYRSGKHMKRRLNEMGVI